MKKYTFGFYPNNRIAEISVITDTKSEAESLLRRMILDCFFDDGLSLIKEEDCE